MYVNWLSYHQISRLSNVANQLEDQTTSCTLLFIRGVLVGVPGRQAGWWCVLRGKCFKVRTHASCTEKLLIWFSEFYLQEQETVLIYKLIIYKLKSSIYDLWICEFFYILAQRNVRSCAVNLVTDSSSSSFSWDGAVRAEFCNQCDYQNPLHTFKVRKHMQFHWLADRTELCNWFDNI